MIDAGFPRPVNGGVTVQFNKEASRTRDLVMARKRHDSRGSPRSLAAQKRLARDDNKKIPVTIPIADTLEGGL